MSSGSKVGTTNEFLPFRYHIEIYARSFHNDPFFHAKAKSPFPVPAIGHHLDARNYQGHDLTTRRLRIVDVEHLLWTIEDSHVSHKLMIAVTEAAED